MRMLNTICVLARGWHTVHDSRTNRKQHNDGTATDVVAMLGMRWSMQRSSVDAFSAQPADVEGERASFGDMLPLLRASTLDDAMVAVLFHGRHAAAHASSASGKGSSASAGLWRFRVFCVSMRPSEGTACRSLSAASVSAS